MGVALSVEPDPLPALQRPCLRRDLEFTHRRLGDAVEVIVCDPLTGSYFRAGELEAALFALLDGETPLDEITARLTRNFPDVLAEEVPAFISHLGALGFLEGSKAARAHIPLYQRLLYGRLRVANPDRLFARLVPHVGWLYRPAGWTAVAALFLAAWGVALGSRAELLVQTARAYRPELLLGLWLGTLLTGTIHEFGHGLTCKYFGGRSTGIGLLFIYGIPCFYCDVSGAWMLPQKSQRIWVGAAGLYYQFIAGALALLLWRVLDPGSVLSSILLMMIASCSALALINLHPLLKLDGYYLLSDALEIPNLRQRAFAELGQRLGRFWFGTGQENAETANVDTDEGEQRVRRICLVYAALTAVFLGWLISAMLWSLGGFFTGRLGGTGAVLFFLLAGLTFGPPVARAAAAFGRRLAQWKGIPLMARRRLLLAGGCLALVPPALTLGQGELHLLSPCKLAAGAGAAVRARTAGRLAELTTHEGARVRRGEILGHLATFERQQQQVELNAQLRTVRLEIAALAERLPIIAAEAEKGAAEAATGAQETRTQLAEERQMQPPRIAEARWRAEAARADVEAAQSRLAEARAAVEAQSRIAARLRADADQMARGDYPPALAAAREEWRRRVLEQDLAQRDRQRIQLLVADGAVAPQQLDLARSRDETAARRTEEALQGMTAVAKNLREAAEDAEAELARRRATQEAARAAAAAARATEAAARETARLVLATSSPARLETARQRAASGAAVLAAARAARGEPRARRSELDAKRQEAERLVAQIAVLTHELRSSDLIVPCDGVVTTPRVEERIGAYYGEGTPILQVEDVRSLSTRISVNEKDLQEVQIGQPVALRVAAFPQQLYRGRVSEIAPRAVRDASSPFPTNIVEVRAQIENPTGELRPGISGWAKIDCGRRSLGAIVLRRVARYLRTEVWGWF